MKHAPFAAAPTSSKRRWKGKASAVLALVFFSLLVPFVFLFGIHARFPSSSAILTYERTNQDSGFSGLYEGFGGKNPPQYGKGSTAEELIRKIGQTLPKDIGNTTYTIVEISRNATSRSYSSQSEGSSPAERVLPKSSPLPETIPFSHRNKEKSPEMAVKNFLSGEETKKPCELEFGSYCLWSIEHKEQMKDSMVKKLKDQLFVARAYYPTIAKVQDQENFSREMKQNIQEHERMLSEAIVDADLPSFAGTKVEKMEQTINKAKSFNVECGNVDKKLRQILDLTEDEAHFHMRQSAFLYHLNIETMPKSLHCLSMRLTVEYFRDSPPEMELRHAEKFENSAFHHYVILSKNILAASVTVNSTAMNYKESENLVFHLLTDRQNYFAMKFWFSKNSYRRASIRVLNIEDLDIKRAHNLGVPQLSLSEEFRLSVQSTDQPSQPRTEYTSVFGHSHFLLPEIFKNLKRVIVLDDDIVVQHDLTHLWSLNLQGNVIGAHHVCNVRLGQLKNYLGLGIYNPESCTWMSGLSIVDLEKWREHGISRIYEKLIRKVHGSETSWRMDLLSISFLVFQNVTFPLENSWMFSGLGNNYRTSLDEIEKSAVLHYNGNMKPWLELGIPEYKRYWRKFLTHGNQYMDECNANL